MLTLPVVRIYLVAEAVDLRRGFDGLAAATRGLIGESPLSGHLFMFLNRPTPATPPILLILLIDSAPHEGSPNARLSGASAQYRRATERGLHGAASSA